MTTIYHPAEMVTLTRGAQSGVGGMREVTTVPVIPNELVPFQPALHGVGQPGIPDAPCVRAGMVSRGALFARLAEAERVVQVSALAGSGIWATVAPPPGDTPMFSAWAGFAVLAGYAAVAMAAGLVVFFRRDA